MSKGKYRKYNLGPNAKHFMAITTNSFIKIMDNYMQEVKRYTGMDISIDYRIDYSILQLQELDNPTTALTVYKPKPKTDEKDFNTSYWNHMMEKGIR